MLEATTNALSDITEKLKLAQQATEEMFLTGEEAEKEDRREEAEKEDRREEDR